MNDYRIIFQKRADDYHFAMQEYPNVRKDEFQNLISNTNFAKITEVLDIPSGGGYLKNYIPKHVNVTFTDFSEGFTNETVKLVKPEKLPFSSESFDIVYSLSGMHHLNNVTLFIEECLRVIRADGDFIFADVKKGTSVDEFLNEFVNKYNSLGHTGDFLSHDYFENQPNIQNKIVECKYKEYPFTFTNQKEMIVFFKLFFGLDKANETEIYEGIRDILGITDTDKGLEVNWGLIHFKLKK